MITLFGKPEPTLMERLKDSVSKTRTELSARVEQILTGDRPVDPALLAQLEAALLSADIGVATTREIIGAMRAQVNEHKLEGAATLKTELKRQIVKMLEAPQSKAGSNGASGSWLGGSRRPTSWFRWWLRPRMGRSGPASARASHRGRDRPGRRGRSIPAG